jgi:hypothetical protein
VCPNNCFLSYLLLSILKFSFLGFAPFFVALDLLTIDPLAPALTSSIASS